MEEPGKKSLGIYQFLQKAAENKGVKYDEAKADSLIESYNNDYDKIVGDVGLEFGYKPEQIDEFKKTAFQKYNIQPITPTVEAPVVTKSAEPIQQTQAISYGMPLVEAKKVAESRNNPINYGPFDKEVVETSPEAKQNFDRWQKDQIAAKSNNQLPSINQGMPLEDAYRTAKAPAEPKAKTGFWDTYAGDTIEAFGGGMAVLGEWLPRIQNMPYKIAANVMANQAGITPAEKQSVVDAMMYMNPFTSGAEAVGTEMKKIQKSLQNKSDRYNGDNFIELWKQGKPMEAAGQIMLEATRSLPISIGAMAAAMTGAMIPGLIVIGAGSAAVEYENLTNPELNGLDQRSLQEYNDKLSMGEFAKISNAILSGVGEAGSELLGSIPFIKWMKATPGAGEVVKKGIAAAASKFFEKYGLLTEPVTEGIEEFANTIWKNSIDKVTGIREDWNPTEGALESFVYGFAGGAQFTPVGLTKSVYQKYTTSKDFEQGQIYLGEIANTDYAEAVKNAVNNYAKPEEVLFTVDQLTKDMGASTEDYLRARNYAASAVNYNRARQSRQREIEEAIGQFRDNSGNITTTEIDGLKYYIRNTEDLGKEGKVIYVKDENGKVKPVFSSKIKQWNIQTPEEVIADAANSDELKMQQQAANEAAQKIIAEKGIQIGSNVEVPEGKGSVIAITEDGMINVETPKGQQLYNVTDVALHYTPEQKAQIKAEEQAAQEAEKMRQELTKGIDNPDAQIISDETEVMSDGTELRVIDFDNGQSKFLTPEGEQIVGTQEERDNLLVALLTPKTEAKIDELSPEDAYNEIKKERPEVAAEILTGEIEDMRSQAAELRKAKGTRTEKLEAIKQAETIEAEAARLETILHAEAQKLTESVKKNQESENKSTEIKSELSANESTKDLVNAESPQKIEPGSEAGSQNNQLEAQKADIEKRRQEELQTELLPIERVKRKNGAIGTQGVTTEQVAAILKNILGLNASKNASMKDLVDLFLSDKNNVDKLLEFTKNNPISITELPDGTIQINDGHHRAFLIDQAGITEIPATRNNIEKIDAKYNAELAALEQTKAEEPYQESPIKEQPKEPAKDEKLNAPLRQNGEAGTGAQTENAPQKEQGQGNQKGLEQDVISVINELQAKAPNAAPVVIVRSINDIPSAVKNHPSFSPKIQGFWYNNKIYIIPEMIKSRDDLVAFWIHENGLHNGIRNIVPADRLAELMELVHDSFIELAKTNKEFRAIIDKVNEDYKGLDDAAAGEEFLAYLTEKIVSEQDLTPIEQTAWNKFLNLFRDFLGKLFNFDGKLLTERQITDIALTAVQSNFQKNERTSKKKGEGLRQRTANENETGSGTLSGVQ